MKKVIFSVLSIFCTVLVFAQNSPLTITDNTAASTNLSVRAGGNQSLDVSPTTGDFGMQLNIRPAGTGNLSFLNFFNSSDLSDFAFARVGSRANYGILSYAVRDDAGTATVPTAITHFAIELDPNNSQSGEAFVVTTGGQNGASSQPNLQMLCKIDLNGVSTTEAKVEATVAPPDYVFANDYNLRSLEEVEAYINENSHLPEIPSAAEFNAEGIKLGKMSFDLLKKVEELTLYMIEMKKENENLKTRISELENK